MTTIEIPRAIGVGLTRVDGPLKVTGAALYPTDFDYPNLAYALLVRGTIAAGRIRSIDTEQAQAAPGVLAVITHRNAPRLRRGPDTQLWRQPPPPLQDDRILYYGQYVALVVASTAEHATAAGQLVKVDYEPVEPMLHLDDSRAELLTNPWGEDAHSGDVAAGLASAAVRVDATYTTPDETNNPSGCSPRSQAGTVTALPFTMPPNGPTRCVPRSRRRSQCRRVAFGCSRHFSVAASVPGYGSGLTWSWRHWPRVRSTSR
jgi:CO/xanthine dehydrogenase Mo-binding subunit